MSNVLVIQSSILGLLLQSTKLLDILLLNGNKHPADNISLFAI